MSTFDFTPLFRSTIGYDRLPRLLEMALRDSDGGNGYPPYNIEQFGEDDYRISMAVAGFGEDDIELTVQEGLLIIKGQTKQEEPEGNYLYKGIARRGFERRFRLEDHVKVTEASLVNGMLVVELKREIPEAMKPKTIAIKRGDSPKAITSKKAA
ncbi:Hsp20 family protein [Oceanibacterium hippocampi]|uniref:Small heat shock protein IbpA n=1 Tax=Oceanibacterium hippocampi TaxID=745714 RepID=A0A1Y5RWW4_9PROT|nr:Hsp20 family protein [Oceanibacterium hippocampi]SLN26864.1 Small heat shock protein IbpA [Oceanibacterium hippocampi]